jgi:hypothetical protein
MRPTWSVLVISGSLTAAALIACGSDDSSPGASGDAGSGSDGTTAVRDAATTLDAADGSATTNPADADADAGGGAGSVAACLTGSTSDAGETAACTTLAQCAQSSCNSQFASAFGADWASGTVSGACAGFYQCVQAAGCGPGAITSCESSIAFSCAGALLTVESCLQDSCASAESACNASIGSVIPTDAGTDAD